MVSEVCILLGGRVPFLLPCMSLAMRFLWICLRMGYEVPIKQTTDWKMDASNEFQAKLEGIFWGKFSA